MFGVTDLGGLKILTVRYCDRAIQLHDRKNCKLQRFKDLHVIVKEIKLFESFITIFIIHPIPYSSICRLIFKRVIFSYKQYNEKTFVIIF